MLDFETTALDYGSCLNPHNKLLLACWYKSTDDSWNHSFGAEYEQHKLLEDINEVDFIVAQNAKFELGWLDRCGIDLHDVLVFDTMLAEWVILGNRKLPKDLNSMLERRGLKGKDDAIGRMIKNGIDPENIHKPLLLRYCLEDVRGTLQLFRSQIQELTEREQLHLIYSRCLLTPVLTDIEAQGVTLDKEAVNIEYEKASRERREAEEALNGFGTINWNSRKQVAQLLYTELGFEEIKDRKGNPVRTPAGAQATDTATLSKLRATTAKQREFLEAFAKLAKANARLSKTLNFFKEICDNHDCTFYGIFNQGATATHRLSSSGRPVVAADGSRYSAQLQNLPREYKSLFVAKEEGWQIVEADGSQLEFRAAADLARDEVAYEEICNNVDIHTNTATVFVEDGTHPDFKGLTVKEARQPAKGQTFKPLYGGMGNNKAEKNYCEFFRNKYKGIAAMQSGWTYEVLKNKKLRTPYGMEFYWPDTSMSRSGYITNTTSIYNYPVQGFATAEIIPIVVVSLWHRLRGWQVKLVLTVHDSVALEIGPDVDREKLKREIGLAFTEDVYNYLSKAYNYQMVVPLGIEVKIGDRLGSGKGEKAVMYPDGDRELLWQDQ